MLVCNIASSVFRGGACDHGPPPRKIRKHFLTRYSSKWDFKPIYFAQKCPQNAGNAVSETQISKNFRGACPRTPLQLCRHYGLPLNKILATPLNIAILFYLEKRFTSSANRLNSKKSEQRWKSFI